MEGENDARGLIKLSIPGVNYKPARKASMGWVGLHIRKMALSPTSLGVEYFPT
jgi:hypothetical protein